VTAGMGTGSAWVRSQQHIWCSANTEGKFPGEHGGLLALAPDALVVQCTASPGLCGEGRWSTKQGPKELLLCASIAGGEVNTAAELT